MTSALAMQTSDDLRLREEATTDLNATADAARNSALPSSELPATSASAFNEPESRVDSLPPDDSLPPEESVPGDDLEQYLPYRAISTPGVVSAILGVLSILVFLDWVFGLIAVMSLLFGFLSLRQIRNRPLEYAGRPVAMLGIVLSGVLLPVGWGWAAYVYATEVPKDHRRISYELLRPSQDNPPVTNFGAPQTALELDGQKVFIKGYMYPGRDNHIAEFVLCRDNGDCCFGGNPPLTDRIYVRMKDGKRIRYTTWQQKLAGTFRIRHGTHDAIGDVFYHLDEAILR